LGDEPVGGGCCASALAVGGVFLYESLCGRPFYYLSFFSQTLLTIQPFVVFSFLFFYHSLFFWQADEAGVVVVWCWVGWGGDLVGWIDR